MPFTVVYHLAWSPLHSQHTHTHTTRAFKGTKLSVCFDGAVVFCGLFVFRTFALFSLWRFVFRSSLSGLALLYCRWGDTFFHYVWISFSLSRQNSFIFFLSSIFFPQTKATKWIEKIAPKETESANVLYVWWDYGQQRPHSFDVIRYHWLSLMSKYILTSMKS